MTSNFVPTLLVPIIGRPNLIVCRLPNGYIDKIAYIFVLFIYNICAYVSLKVTLPCIGNHQTTIKLWIFAASLKWLDSPPHCVHKHLFVGDYMNSTFLKSLYHQELIGIWPHLNLNHLLLFLIDIQRGTFEDIQNI